MKTINGRVVIDARDKWVHVETITKNNKTYKLKYDVYVDKKGKVKVDYGNGKTKVTMGFDAKGYKEIGFTLYAKNDKYKYVNFLVHRLVAEAFCKKKRGQTEVHHKDGDRLNNNAKNLEWVSREEHHKHTSQLDQYEKGEDRHSAKLTEEIVKYMIPMFMDKISGAEISRRIKNEFGIKVTKENISAIRLHKSWNHITKGIKFPKVENRTMVYDETMVHDISKLIADGIDSNLYIVEKLNLTELMEKSVTTCARYISEVRTKRCRPDISDLYFQ